MTIPLIYRFIGVMTHDETDLAKNLLPLIYIKNRKGSGLAGAFTEPLLGL